MSEPDSTAKTFTSPWEAQVFALVFALQDACVFTANEWSETLGATIRAEDGEEVSADYLRWVEALETLLARKGVFTGAEVGSRSEAFLRAARATPHGEPILLENDPMAGLA